MGTSEDIHKTTKHKLDRQVATDEPDVSGRELNIGQDQIESNKNRLRILKAIRLGERSSKPGDVRTHAVKGVDRDQKSSRSASYGPNQASTQSDHKKVTPNSVMRETSSSSIKIASAKMSESRKRLRKLKAEKSTALNYKNVILSEPAIISIPTESLPMVPYPKNDSDEVKNEIETIFLTQEDAPLPESVMDLAGEEPLELFKRACIALGVPVDDEIAPLLIQDLRRIAISLKYVHLRPRPQEVAPYHGRNITLYNSDPYDDTPSYPSVHATIGYGLANMYASMYPEFSQEFMTVGDTIALQRVQSGRHYPSDNEYARIIAMHILGDSDVE